MKKTKDQQISNLQTLLKDSDDSRDFYYICNTILSITSVILFMFLMVQFRVVDSLVRETREYRRIDRIEKMIKFDNEQIKDSHLLCDKFTSITKIKHTKYFNSIGCRANGVHLDSFSKLNSAIDHFKLGAK